jgi:uncharacterized protein YdeI (BOF family)
MSKEIFKYEFPDESSFQSPGMTLRDYFAAKALQGMTADMPIFSEGPIVKQVTAKAYEFADAMLKAREA